MLDKLRAQMAGFLAAHDVALLTTAGSAGAWAMPARYLARGLAVDCLVPRWADVAHLLEQDPRVLLVIPSQISDFRFQMSDGQTAPQSATLRFHPGQVPKSRSAGLCWLQLQGTAQLVADPDWVSLLPDWTAAVAPADLYLVVRVTPTRIDLFDESRGWGARETVEM